MNEDYFRFVNYHQSDISKYVLYYEISRKYTYITKYDISTMYYIFRLLYQNINKQRQL